MMMTTWYLHSSSSYLGHTFKANQMVSIATLTVFQSLKYFKCSSSRLKSGCKIFSKAPQDFPASISLRSPIFCSDSMLVSFSEIGFYLISSEEFDLLEDYRRKEQPFFFYQGFNPSFSKTSNFVSPWLISLVLELKLSLCIIRNQAVSLLYYWK